MLDFEIEEYVSAVGGATLVAWVRVPNLSSSVDTDIYIYYGNPDVACSQENPAGVWDSNYQAVWHLNETPSGAGDIKDSTGTHDGTSTNMEAGDQTTGQIDGSLAFDGVNENVSVPDHGDWTFSGGEKRTYEGWFNFNVLPSTGDWDAIVEGSAGEYAFQFGESGGSLRLVWYDNLSGDYYSPPISILAGEWHQYVLTLDLGVVNGSHWYLDGVDQGAFTAPNTTLNPNGLRLGGTSIFPEDLFGGALDEIRISNSVRSPGWIQTEFNNQNNPTKNPTCSDSGFVCLGDEEGGPWDFPWAYGYRKKLTIDPAKVTCGGDISNFPLLVSLVDADLKNRAFGGKVEHAKGHDITFRDSDGQTSLDHEVESYDATTGALVAWVRVPTVSTTLGTDIYMYFGNPEAACSVENVAGVWDSNYLAVWHLSETPSGANDIKDSTGTHHGTSVNMEASDQAAGQINGSLTFDGVNENVSMTDHGDWTISSGDKRTYEGWFNFSVLPGVGDWDTIVQDPNWGYAFQFTANFGGGLRLNWYDGLTDYYSPPISILAGERHHYVLTLDFGIANGSHWYLDGVDQGAFTAPNISQNPTELTLGGSAAIPACYFTGELDEVRISDSIRSSCWIQTQYNNQSSPSTFFSIGAMDPDPPTAVQLVAFTATSGDSEVLLEWETGSETNNLGFNLYRATSTGGYYERITSVPIPGLGTSPEGKIYSYTDSGLTNGVTYYYKLEDIETTGETKEHGPVWATPQATENLAQKRVQAKRRRRVALGQRSAARSATG
jgi:hypothetical protein